MRLFECNGQMCVLYTNILDVNGKAFTQQQKCVAFTVFRPSICEQNLRYALQTLRILAIYHKDFIVAIKQLIMRQMNGLVGICSIRKIHDVL